MGAGPWGPFPIFLALGGRTCGPKCQEGDGRGGGVATGPASKGQEEMEGDRVGGMHIKTYRET